MKYLLIFQVPGTQHYKAFIESSPNDVSDVHIWGEKAALVESIPLAEVRAAPYLLSACKRALDLLNEQNEGDMPSPTIVCLTAAIAKAGGVS